MSENSTLTIHTQMPPDSARVFVRLEGSQAARRRRGRAARQKRRNPAVKAAANACPGNFPAGGRPVGASKPRATFSDRLLRNSAIACAVLLGVLALGNIRQPWAEKASAGIEKALTMHINLDDSLGELTFVRSLMPESALVFLNVSGGAAMARPSEGTVRHPWSAMQPWTLFDGADGAIRAVDAGTVTAVSPLSGGQFGVLVDHGRGVESVYANLGKVSVAQGDTVEKGAELGSGGDGLYFELRENGESVDPSERLGLS